jgi:two-component system, NtrC family, sensor histidine kinase HydH
MNLAGRAQVLFDEHCKQARRRANALFLWLMIGQWLFSIVLALVFSPYAWAGRSSVIHVHVYAAIILGGLISAFPLALIRLKPDAKATPYVVTCAQMLWSALLIHLTGGRIETHFHVFGSLAFVAFYREWKLLLPATVVVAGDHLLRGMFWPESVYGIANPEWWRFLEHAFWVAFEDTVLIFFCLNLTVEMRGMAMRQAEVEMLSASDREKSIALDAALRELTDKQAALVRSEKLAAVGQLAASVGHELRNPLAAVRNAATYLSRRVLDAKPGAPPLTGDAKVKQFFTIIDRELDACRKTIADLLDFARERAPDLRPCPFRPLVDEAISLVPSGSVRIENSVPDDLPIPNLDRDQFRQILINLVQNAVDAVPPETSGQVTITAEGGGVSPFRVTIADTGAGIPDDVLVKIFEPLFTTKAKGTGLGLAVVSNMVKSHRGHISVTSEVGAGTTFAIELPAGAAVPS